MLIRFKVSNFLSFEDEQEFSMIAGITQKKATHIIESNKLKLLKFSTVYGANASGKSNLLNAFAFSKYIILRGIRSNCSNLYCKIKNKNKEKISSFEYEIKMRDKFYAYGFDILLSKNAIKAEWLIELDKTKGKEVLIYSRELGKDIEINENYFNNDDNIVNRLNFYHSDMKQSENILFLTVMNKNKDTLYSSFTQNNIIVFKEIFDWFKNNLIVVSPNIGVDNSQYFTSDENIEKISEIMSTFGTGISKCKIVDINPDEARSNQNFTQILGKIERELYKIQSSARKKRVQLFVRVNRELIIATLDNSNIKYKKIILEHKNNDGEFYFSEESDGTQRLFDLIGILMNRNSDRVYLVDELDRCLHPTLTYEFVRRFLSNIGCDTQLIVTTHESRLLNFDLLRRDEIWFIDRDKNGPSKIYSLEEYNERFDKKIDKAYLEGRYGGVPIFETVFPIGDLIYENSQ